MYTTLSPLLIGERVTLLKDLKARDEKKRRWFLQEGSQSLRVVGPPQ